MRHNINHKYLVMDARIIISALFILWACWNVKYVTDQDQNPFDDQLVILKAIIVVQIGRAHV